MLQGATLEAQTDERATRNGPRHDVESCSFEQAERAVVKLGGADLGPRSDINGVSLENARAPGPRVTDRARDESGADTASSIAHPDHEADHRPHCRIIGGFGAAAGHYFSAQRRRIVGARLDSDPADWFFVDIGDETRTRNAARRRGNLLTEQGAASRAEFFLELFGGEFIELTPAAGGVAASAKNSFNVSPWCFGDVANGNDLLHSSTIGTCGVNPVERVVHVGCSG